MKFNIKSYTLFFFLTIMFFSPLTLAPWSLDNPPKKPDDDNSRTCAQWIHHHGFLLGKFVENRELSLGRDYRLDPFASVWAAIYAFVIGGAVPPKVEVTPEVFCDDHVQENIVFPFSTIKDERRTCEDWIVLYGYIKYASLLNIPYASSQNFIRSYAISLWADSYGSYLEKWKTPHALTPFQFCAKIGKTANDNAIMPFISRRVTEFTCEEWIKLYEFTDNLLFNYEKAEIMYEQKMEPYINYWPKEYAKFIRVSPLSEVRRHKMTPGWYCNSNVDDPSTKFNFSYPSEELERMLLGDNY